MYVKVAANVVAQADGVGWKRVGNNKKKDQGRRAIEKKMFYKKQAGRFSFHIS